MSTLKLFCRREIVELVTDEILDSVSKSKTKEIKSFPESFYNFSSLIPKQQIINGENRVRISIDVASRGPEGVAGAQLFKDSLLPRLQENKDIKDLADANISETSSYAMKSILRSSTKQTWTEKSSSGASVAQTARKVTVTESRPVSALQSNYDHQDIIKKSSLAFRNIVEESNKISRAIRKHAQREGNSRHEGPPVDELSSSSSGDGEDGGFPDSGRAKSAPAGNVLWRRGVEAANEDSDRYI